jgi:hypothetical protein
MVVKHIKIKMKKNLKLKINNESGQAIFEFLLFLPLMLVLYSITLTFYSSINGSINQQKVVRGYFYNIIQNNSQVPTKEVLRDIQSKEGVTRVGMSTNGWKTDFINQSTPLAPCYKILSLSSATSQEKCDPGNKTGDSTQFVRVKTVYGICGSTFSSIEDGQFKLSVHSRNLVPTADFSSCLNIQ